MKFYLFAIAKDDKGIFPIVIGQPSNHYSNWSGLNLRYVILFGWNKGKRLADCPITRRILKALLKNVQLVMAFNDAFKIKLRKTTGNYFNDQENNKFDVEYI